MDEHDKVVSPATPSGGAYEPIAAGADQELGSGAVRTMSLTPRQPTRRLTQQMSKQGLAERAVSKWLWLTKDPSKVAAYVFFMWVVLGIYMYMSRPWGENQHYYDLVESLYVMVQIVTTVGYGDLTPAQPGGYLFTACYVLTAVVVVSSVVGAITDRLIKSHEAVAARLSTELVSRALGGDVSESMQHRQTVPYLAEFTKFAKAFGLWSCFVAVGTLFFHFHPGERKSLVEAFYMSVVTLTTVGFGDQTPVTRSGKIFAMIWMLLGVAAFANMIGRFAAIMTKNEGMNALQEDDLLRIMTDPIFLKGQTSADRSGEPVVRRADFILFMLCDMELVDQEIVSRLDKNFDTLDKDGNGYLNEEDIETIQRAIDARRLAEAHVDL